jgi:AMP nucleosidase
MLSYAGPARVSFPLVGSALSRARQPIAEVRRAAAIDMESATIAARGRRFRTPWGTRLRVSDKPPHEEIELPGRANAFYERAISQHLRIAIAAIDPLRMEGPRLHSRKLRSFDEPPFC